MYGIEVIEIPRFMDINGTAISAKEVRKALNNNDWEKVAQLVPETTLAILKKYDTNHQSKIKAKDRKTITK